MEKLLGVFSPGFLLRSLFAGTFFLIAYLVAMPPADGIEGLKPSIVLAIGLPASLFAGVITYTFHRSVIYALVEWALNSSTAKSWRKSKPLISEKTIEVLLSQWRRSSGAKKLSQGRARNFSTWADYAHLQYTAALCILFGAWCGRVVSTNEMELYCPLVWLGAALFGAGLVADWRLHVVRERVEALEEKELRETRAKAVP